MLVVSGSFSYESLISGKTIDNREMEVPSEEALISGVPYVCQETDFYCAYACPTMIFRYYGVNTSLSEVLFNSGVGYSLLYSPPYLRRFPVGCIVTCKWGVDRLFLADVYGLSFSESQTAQYETDKDRWESYWLYVRQNISAGCPVVTYVDPMRLPSLRNAIRAELGIDSKLWIGFSDVLWDLSPSYMYHAIVLVGYNEKNQSVCYHDPAAGLYGHAEFGTYAWMDVQTFRRALHSLYVDSPLLSYVVEVFSDDPVVEPLEKSEAFNRSYERNIQKMCGNHSVYDPIISEDWTDTYLGFSGASKMVEYFSKGFNNRFMTSMYYRFLVASHFLAAEYRFGVVLGLVVLKSFNVSVCPNFINKFRQIALEKETIARYLASMRNVFHDVNLSRICERDAMLLLYESQNWSLLADRFDFFLWRGLCMSMVLAMKRLDDMIPYAANIVMIENELSGPVAI